MEIKIYDIKKEGIKFKADFNKFERIKKILDERKDDQYSKIDLVSDKAGKLFVCVRFANFTTNKARMDLEEVQGFKKTK